MRIDVVTAPVSEPLSVAEAKLYLTVDHTDDDALIAALITAAREYVERATSRALAEQTLRLVLDKFPTSLVLPLPRPPLKSVTSVKYYDTDGTLQTWDTANYEVATESLFGAIVATDGWPGDVHTFRPDAVTIEYVAGAHADTERTMVVPETLLVAMRYYVEHWYDRREAVNYKFASEATPMPLTTQMLVNLNRLHYRLPE